VYTITFYSFKGGVGRTMSLVNSACELASRGKKVLIVDFDLEAPGITSFPAFSVSGECEGIVDFVTKYTEVGISPDITQYVHKATPAGIETGEIWVLPSGSRALSYENKFSQINWRELYEVSNGYLLIEDLWAQLKEKYNFDYVLVDSRTGYTDVGGICTRQVPDAVAICFFPNDQNLHGLKTIVEKIRSEDRQQSRPIAIYFVASNVPDLDDEDDITSRQLSNFKALLNFGDVNATIHHYPSLQMLNQVIFTTSRRKSSLAAEYRHLVDVITSRNLEDFDVSVKSLSEIQGIVGRPSHATERSITSIEEDLNFISKAHARNGEIQFRMGVVRERMGDFIEARELYSRAIDLGYERAPVLLGRANLARKLNDSDRAVADIEKALRLRDLTPRDAIFAVRWMTEISPAKIKQISSFPWVANLDALGLNLVATELMSSRATVPSALEFLDRASAFNDPEVLNSIESKKSLCYIANGDFDVAMRRLAPEGIEAETNIADVFNYAMAEWGDSGSPVVSSFSRVLDLAKTTPNKGNANYPQCLALANYVCGNMEEATERLRESEFLLKQNPTKTFSCWTYLESSVTSFRHDLDEMKQLLQGNKLMQPPVVSQREARLN
jgi:cellulose biosynthesis protein BcsQ